MKDRARSESKKDVEIYYVHVEVCFVVPLALLGERGKASKVVKGYFQEVGVTCCPNDLEQTVAAFVLKKERRENIRLEMTYIGRISQHNLEKEILMDDDIGPSLIGDPNDFGVWYSTGKAYFF